MKNTEKEIFISSYLKWNLNKTNVIDLPCYTSPAVQREFMKNIKKSCKAKKSSDECTEIVTVMAPLMKNPNAPDKDGRTSIYWAAFKGHTEIVKILTQLTSHPNSPDKNGETAIYKAAYEGHTEIVKFLASLSDNPNAPNKDEETPLYWAAHMAASATQ